MVYAEYSYILIDTAGIVVCLSVRVSLFTPAV